MLSPGELAPFVPRLLLDRPSDAPRRWSADATMAFIDISGFTALSEQLARHGRRGAEELVSTLTRIFTLLMSATDDGGDVVKFAGDAMLVMYQGPDHVRHACHAAAAAQCLLRVVGGVRLTDARARLRMSVGVHTGRFDLMLTGRDSENLVVTGPALDRLLSLQDTAVAGQVLISRQVADRLPSSAVGGRARVGRVLGRMPAVPSVAAGPHRPAMDVARFLPAAFTERPDLLRADSDHRRTAMAFVQVSWPDGRPVDDTLALVDALTDVVETACRRHDVTLLDTDLARGGYRYFLTAGAPHGLEDPEGHLLRALLEVLAADTPLAVRAGTASGQVFAGPVGAPQRRTYSVMGDTTNLAARLTSKALPGTVLAPAALPGRSHTRFALRPLPPVTLKGKTEPVPVVVVERVLGQRGRPEQERAFVGRVEELELLRAGAAGLLDGDGACVEIVGEPGTGKTRLAVEAGRRSGLPVVPLLSDPYTASVPYGALARLLRPLLGLTDEDAPTSGRRLLEVADTTTPWLRPWLPLLAPAVGADLPGTTAVEELDDRFRSARFHIALRDLLRALVPDPTVIVVDDGQWLDQTSADALAAVVDDLTATPWLVLFTRRGETGERPERPDRRRIDLRPLPTDAAMTLVGEAAPVGLRRAEAEAIVERSGGNPYFLLELSASATTAGLPDTVEDIVGLRIDDLTGDERDLLRQAAVLGSTFPAALFAAVTGHADLADAVRRPGLAPFLEVGDHDSIRFRRELHREVAYGQLTFARRRDLHVRAARAIADRPEQAGVATGALLALHSYAGGDWPAAYRACTAAADLATAQFAHDEAVGFLRHALDAGRRCGADADALRPLRLQLAESLRMTGHLDAAADSLTRARRGLTDPTQLAAVVDRIGYVRHWGGRVRPSLVAATEVARLADRVPAPRGQELRTSAELLRAGVWFWKGDAGRCRRHALVAVDLASALPRGRTRTGFLARAYTLHDTATIELEGRAGRYGDRPLAMYRRIGDLYAEGRFAVNVAVGEYYEGRWSRAVELYRRSLDLAERIGDVFGVAVAQMNIGELLSLQGFDDEAVELLRSSLTQLDALGTPQAAAHAACYLGQALRLRGDLDEAALCLDRSAELFTLTGATQGFAVDELATRRLQLDLALGHDGGAFATADAFLARPLPLIAMHRARVLRVRAEAGHRLGRADRARRDLDESLELARSLPLGYEAALALLLEAAWGEHPTAYAEAMAILDALGAGARARLGLGGS